MINENDIALIDAFIAGKLIGNDKTDFEMRVRSDLEFAKAVRQQIHAVEHLEIFGAVQMGASLRQDMSQWKQQGGYKPYKSDMLAKSMMMKVIGTVVVLAAAAGAVWYFFLKEAPPKVEPLPTQETELPEPVEYAPEPPATDTSVSFTELKTSEDQIADIQLNIQDPTTFSIIELSAIDGVYTYQIAYDDVVQVIQSQDPDMDERLTQMANDAIEENKQRQAPAKTTTPTKTTNIKPAPKPATKPPAEKKEAAPVKQPPAQTKPVIKKPKEKVVNDIPY